MQVIFPKRAGMNWDGPTTCWGIRNDGIVGMVGGDVLDEMLHDGRTVPNTNSKIWYFLFQREVSHKKCYELEQMYVCLCFPTHSCHLATPFISAECQS